MYLPITKVQKSLILKCLAKELATDPTSKELLSVMTDISESVVRCGNLYCHCTSGDYCDLKVCCTFPKDVITACFSKD